MNILLPWSLASYFPYHGFRAHYRGLADADLGGARLLIPAPVTEQQYQRLVTAGLYQRNLAVPPPAWAREMPRGCFGFRDHVAAFDAAELSYVSMLPGDVELHHSTPVTAGTRPFALLCDSVAPLFHPHLPDAASASNGRAQAVRDFYRAMFEAEPCLALISSSQATLDQLSTLFASSTIDRKLARKRYPTITGLPVPWAKRPAAPTTFLFMNSAHGEAHSFVMSGGLTSLRLALLLLSAGDAVRFCFRSRRPADAQLVQWGIDPAALAEFEHNGILWIDPGLDQVTQTAWIAASHFLLMPGAVVQPEAVAIARACGTIPIVSDIAPEQAGVTDDIDGLVVTGLRSRIITPDPASGVPLWSRTEADRADARLAQDLAARVRAVLAEPGRRASMAAAAARHAVAAEGGDGSFAAAVTSLLDRRMRESPSAVRPHAKRLHDLPWGEDAVADLTEDDFIGPATPELCAAIGTGRIFALRQYYVFVPDEQLPATDSSNWSLLDIARLTFDRVSRMRMVIGTDLAAVADAGVRQAVPLGGQGSHGAVDGPPVDFREIGRRLAYYHLRQHPRLLHGARSIYQMLRRLRAHR